MGQLQELVKKEMLEEHSHDEDHDSDSDEKP